MPSAGPSRQDSSPLRRTKRKSDVEEIFEKQDVDEKRELNKNYRELQASADEMKQNVGNTTATQLLRAMRKQDKLFRNVKDPGLATLDARLMMTTTDTAAAMARKLKIDKSSFDVDEFLVRIRSTLGIEVVKAETIDDELGSDDEGPMERDIGLGDWEKLGWMAAEYYRRVPGLEFGWVSASPCPRIGDWLQTCRSPPSPRSYGPLSVQHQKRTMAKRAKRAELAPETRPQESLSATQNQGNKNDTVGNVVVVGKTLMKLDPERKGIPFYKLVINPDSFGQTIENMFYTSFLVHEGKVRMTVDEDGEMTIRTEDPHDPDADGDIPKNQTVLEMDMETWELAKEVYGITKPAIPHRKQVLAPTLGERR
ncbi:non-structural maintenance of chromosomes element 4, partial [Tremellales sp. Uapishka_1]